MAAFREGPSGSSPATGVVLTVYLMFMKAKTTMTFSASQTHGQVLRHVYTYYIMPAIGRSVVPFADAHLV